MTVRAYRTQPFQTTHENRIYDELLKALNDAWGNSEELVILIGNFYCQNSEIDAAILKRNSISVIDFKDYEGNISFSENGSWFADGTEIRGGNKGNPYLQIRDNKFALLNFLKGIDALPSRRQPNLGHISGIVLFHRPIKFDRNQLPRAIAPWFHIVDFDHIIECLAQITSREIDLSVADLEELAVAFSISEYVPIGTQRRISKQTAKSDKEIDSELPPSLQSVMIKIVEFITSPERIFVISGMIGTGIERLYKTIANEAVKHGRNNLVLAPNRRIASRYPVNADSIYTHIYSISSKIEKGLIVHSIAENHDSANQIYVVGDCHLISDSQFETDVERYGTGQLLTDFIHFVDLDASQRQVIFIGDRFQMTRGKTEETALSIERLSAISNFNAKSAKVEFLLPGVEGDPFISNCIAIANSIEENVFNQLTISLNDSRRIKTPTEESEKMEILRDIFDGLPETAKYIAYTHAEVNHINNLIRNNIFKRGNEMCAGDIVHVHNGFFVAKEGGAERPTYVPNDSFAEVLSVDENVENLIQPLKGRDQPVTVPLFKVRVRLLTEKKEVEFFCLKNYIYAEKPDLGSEILLALQVHAESRFREEQKKNKELDDLIGVDDSQEAKITEKAETDTLKTRFFRNDPFLNAARLRFGYALTLHRAQGDHFDTVIANLDTGIGQTSETYFRWLYTLFTIPQNKLVLLNVPTISLFSKAKWDGSKARFDPVKTREIIRFDQSPENNTDTILPFEIKDKSLQNLFFHVVGILRPLRIEVNSLNHKPYQEVYGFVRNANASCTLRLYYNKKYQVTRIETAISNPPEFADEIRQAVTPSIRLDTKFQEMIFEQVEAKLKQYNLSISSVEHYAYQEVYYVTAESGDVKLQIYYDGDGFVTRFVPTNFSDRAVVDILRSALGF